MKSVCEKSFLIFALKLLQVLSAVTANDNTTTSKNTSTLPKWAQNLKAWSKNVADGLAAKQKPIQLKKEGSKGGSKSLTLVNVGGTGSTELPPLTPPVVNPLLNDSGELDPQKVLKYLIRIILIKNNRRSNSKS